MISFRNLKQDLTFDSATNCKRSVVKLFAFGDTVGSYGFRVRNVACTPLRVEVIRVVLEL
jgi:hypothetical protein